MPLDQNTGKLDIRANFYDKTIKGFAMREYKFKQALNIASTDAWNNFFYREKSDPLAASGSTLIKGIPRGAAFPQAKVLWERIQTNIQKYGLEDNIHWEDIISNDIPMQERTLIRIAEGVVKSVDDEICNVLTERTVLGGNNINSFAATISWAAATADIFGDLGRARQLIAEANYPTNDLIAFVTPKMYKDITSYVVGKGSQFPAISEGTAVNGIMSKMNGITFVQSISTPTSCAVVVVPKRCATWRELWPLQTVTKEDPMKSVMVRAAELGVTQLTDVKAVAVIWGVTTGIAA